jgi:WD40 repeat protein
VDLASLLDLYRQVREGKRVKDDGTNPLVPVLRLSGVCHVEGDRLRVRNRIYDRVFDKGWVLAHMPDAELRRQPDGHLFVIADSGGGVTVSSITRAQSQGTPLTRFQAHNGYIKFVTFSPDGKTLATCGVDGKIKLWNTCTWRLTLVLPDHRRNIYWLAFSPDG